MSRRSLGLWLVLAVLAGARAEEPAPVPLQAWAQSFEREPAKALAKAAADLRQHPPGDLTSLLAVTRLVGAQSVRLGYGAVLEDLLDRAIPACQRAGRLVDLAELYRLRAQMARVLLGGELAPNGKPRLGAARVAWFEALAESADRQARAPRGPRTGRLTDVPRLPRADFTARFGPRYATLLDQLNTQVAQAQDAAAVATMARLLDLVRNVERRADQPRPGRGGLETPEAAALSVTARLLWLRGAEALLPTVRTLLVERRDVFRGCWPTASLAAGCTAAWSGSDDAFRDGFYWAAEDARNRDLPADESFVLFAGKLIAFGREREAKGLLRAWLDASEAGGAGATRDAFAGNVARLASPKVTESQRSQLLTLACRSWAATRRGSDGLNALMASLKEPEVLWPAAQRAEYLTAAGVALLNCARCFETPALRAEAANRAAGLLDRAGKKDVAATARGMATTLASSDAAADWSQSLADGREAMARGEHAEAEKALHRFAAARPGDLGQGKDGVKLWMQGQIELASALGQMGRQAEAEAVLTKMAGQIDQLGLPGDDRVKARLAIADHTGDQTLRRECLKSAQAGAKAGGLGFLDDPLAARAAMAAVETQDPATAKTTLLGIIAQDEAKRDRLPPQPDIRTQWFASHLWAYQKLLDLCASTGDGKLALWCGEQMRSRALLDELAWRAVDLAVALPPAVQTTFDHLREERAEVWSQIRALTEVDEGAAASGGSRFVFVPVRGPGQTTELAADPELAKLQARLDALTRREAALEAAVRSAVPAYRRACEQKPLTADELLARLPADTAVLELTFTQNDVVGVAFGADRQPVVRALGMTPSQAIEEAADLRGLLTQRSAEFGSEAKRWYRQLVAPLESALVGAKRLLIVADGPLALVPFAALRDEAGRYVCQRWSVASAPSLTVVWSETPRADAAGTGALVLADPQLSGVVADGATRFVLVPTRGEGVSGQLLAMAEQSLPGARAEGQAVAAKLPDSTLLTGTAATKAAVLARAPQVDVLHFATHGFADPQQPDFSGLLLAADKPPKSPDDPSYAVLTAQEVYLLQLKCRMVTLSACNTGLGRSVKGEGLLGLTRSFLYAGARNVVCSLWQVADVSTAKLMDRLYGTAGVVGDPSLALRDAQLAVMAAPATSHPYFWAAFVVVEGPR